MPTRICLSRTHFLLSFLLVICALAASVWGLTRVSANRVARTMAEPPTDAQPSLSKMLRADGTLDLSRGFQGSLDARGFRMEYANDGAPRFVPAAPAVGGVWDTQFVNANGVQRVANAMAVIGTDVYLGGQFTTAGTTVVNNIARWDGSSWSSLGSGVDGAVYTMVVSGGDLYVGGDFTMAGGAPASNIAKWNGSSWSALGSGVSGGSSDYVLSLGVSGGNVFVGGQFTTAGGAPAANIAKWNGSAWSTLGSGISGQVEALAVSGGDLYAGGQFATAGGISAFNIAKWNGSAWSAVGGGILGQVRALAVSGSDLYAGGRFATAGGIPADNIAKWNGSTWSALGSGVTANPGAAVGSILVVGANVYVNGTFDTAGGNPAKNVAVWNGSAWAAMGNGLENGGLTLYGLFSSLVASGTDIYAAGAITKSGNVEINRIAKWNGSAWSPLGNATNSVNNAIYALAVMGNDVYVAGEFDFAGGVAANNIAKWNGSTWSALGSGLNLVAFSMAVMGGDLYVSGYFSTAGGNPANFIAKWNGSAWSPLGSGLNNFASALVVSGTNLYAGGGFGTAGGVVVNGIARWDGSSWSALGSGMESNVFALAVSGNDLYAGGVFGSAGGNSASRIAKWNGTTWSALGSGLNDTVYSLAVSGSDVYAGGRFTQAGGNAAAGLAKWNGSSWSQVGGGVNGQVQNLLLVGSDLYVGGLFTIAGGNTYAGVAKWDGSAWATLSAANSIDDIPYALAWQGTNLYAGGVFKTLGGTISHYFGRYNTCVSMLTVNNTGDGADATPGNGVCETAAGNGICTLRAAIQEANALAACAPLTINFSVTGTISTATVFPSIVHPNLTINGPGANQLTVSGVPNDHQIFVVSTNNINLNLSGLTIANGYTVSGTNAGSIEFNSPGGQLNVTSCALLNTSGYTIRSHIYSNQSGGMMITDSTISGNTNGYGITVDGTPLTLTNSTVSGNAFAGIRVIAVIPNSDLTLLNCTITSNGLNGIVYSTSLGGSGTIITKNSIIAGNANLQINKGPNVVNSQGNNLCSDASLTPTAAGDLINTNPLLAPLGNYGGATPTHALLPGSPAINAGSLAGAPANDQRGIARSGVADIGAFESRGFTLAMNGGNNQSAVTSTAFTNPLSVGVTSGFSEPVNGGKVTFTPPGSGASATIAGNPATITGGVAATGTVTANSIVGGPYSVTAAANGATPTINFSLTNLNSAPTFTPAATITRQQGSPAGAAVTIGTVNDLQTSASNLVVTQIAGGTANGMTVSGITNLDGTITAVISAGCTATPGTIRFQVSDGDLTGAGDLTVDVTSNTAPNVTYDNASVNAGGSTTNSTTTATDNGSITGYAVQSQGSYTGTISVNASGLVSISNAGPVGSHTITIRATDNCGSTTDASFTLTVGNNLPTITAGAALTRQQGTPGTVSAIATVSDIGTPAGSLIVTATSLPAGITVTSISNANGAITANVTASCAAAIGANTVVLTVTDADNGTATANLLVNVTANLAPTLTYPASEVAQNTATTINPTSASDNGSITGFSIVSVVPPLTVAPTVNASGVVSVTDAGPFGSHTITVRATDNCGAATEASFTLNVGCGSLTVNPETLINGLTFVPYSSTLSASGGSGAYTFTLVSGTLPAGLNLGGNTISGTPNTAGASTFTIRATDDNGCFGERSYTLLIGSTGLMYYPLPRPVRLLDTRPGLSPNACFQPNAPIPGGTSRLQPARGTCEGLTIPPSATTITGNITTVQSGGGFLTIYPSDAPPPLVANSNYLANEIVNNSFTVGVGAADGAVKISVTTDTDVVVDVTGYYAPPATGGLYFHPLPRPVRLLETRAGFTGCFAPAAPLTGGVNTLQQGTGSCQGLIIPPDALALVGNATTVNPAGQGYLTLYPANAAQPLVASSNYEPGQTVNGPFTVGLSPSGQFNIYTFHTTELVIDITGYYSGQLNDANGQGLLYSSLGSPLRLLDTRAGQQGCYTPGAPMTGGTIYTQETQSPCTNLTPAARALIGNATVVNTTGEGYLTFWPGDAAQPLVATSNYTAGQVINRYFTVGLGPDGSFKRFAFQTTDLVVDISGFFAP